MTVCDIDLEVAVEWRVVPRQASGQVNGQFGVYQEIVAGKRLVNTEAWEDWDAGETLVTTVLAERNGKTIYTTTILFPSEEVRDFVLKSGIESGAAKLYDKLADVLTAIVR